LPEPLRAVVEYLDDAADDREFVPTSELTAALGVEAKTFAAQMSELGCRPTRYRLTGEDGRTRQVRGYLVAEIDQARREAVSSDAEGAS